jgi:hypothetical protein
MMYDAESNGSPDEDEHAGWTCRPANLVPLRVRKNSAASNFASARARRLTQEALSATGWMPAFLSQRQERFAGVLKQHWNLAVASGCGLMDVFDAEKTTTRPEPIRWISDFIWNP